MKRQVLYSIVFSLLALTTYGQDVLRIGTVRFIHTTGTQNLFMGNTTGSANTSGTHNAFFGLGSGLVNNSGGFNAFFGANTGYFNTSGTRNTFIGSLAGESTTTGSVNTFIGQGAGYRNTIGHENTFVGTGSGVFNTSGESNVFLGVAAGSENTEGSFNVFIGRVASSSNTTGSYNVTAGFQSGFKSTIGINNAFYGWASGFENTTGSDNSAFGAQSGGLTTTGRYNTFLGKLAGYNNVTGNSNTLIGAGADVFGANKVNLSNATAIGANARVAISNALVLGDSVGVSVGIGTTRPANRLEVRSFSNNTSGLRLTNLTVNSPTVANPGKVLSVNTSGDVILVPGGSGGSVSTHSDSVWVRTASSTYYSGTGNVGIGVTSPFWKLDVNGDINLTSSGTIRMGSAPFIATTPFSTTANILIGYNANTVGSDNILIGNSVGSSSSTGGGNIFIGSQSGDNNQSGQLNTFVGLYTGRSNTVGMNNVFLGSSAGLFSNTGSSNTFIGASAGSNNTYGSGNVFLGNRAGQTNASGAGNVFIGSDANAVGSNASSLFGSVAIGNNAKVTISDAIVLGDSANTNIKVGIGTGTPRYPLDVKGNINIRRGPGGAGKLIFASRSSIQADEQEYIVLTGGKAGESGIRLANLTNQAAPVGRAGQFLSVDGQGRVGLYQPTLSAHQVRLQVANPLDWADHVFAADYPLPSLKQVGQYIQTNGHLPHLPSAQTMTEQGATVQDLVKGLVKTQEEQTRYLLQLQADNEQLRKENAEIRALLKQVLQKN